MHRQATLPWETWQGIIHLLAENRGLKKESKFKKIEKNPKKNRSIYLGENGELRRNTPLRLSPERQNFSLDFVKIAKVKFEV